MKSVDSIGKLNELLKKGNITQSEYEILKAEILNQTTKNQVSTLAINSNSKSTRMKKVLFGLIGISAILIATLSYFFLFPKNRVVVPYLKLNGKYSIVDSISMLPIDTCEFEDCRILSNGFILYNSNSKYGLYSKNGKKITESIYTQISDFEKGFSVVYNEDFQGVIDGNGREIITPKYEEISILSSDFFAVKNYNEWGYCNETGKEIIPLKYEAVNAFSDGLASVKADSKWGYINKDGLMVIPNQYREAYAFKNGFAFVQSQNNNVSLIDKNGKIVISIEGADFIRFKGEGKYELVKRPNVDNWYEYPTMVKSSIIDSNGKFLTNYEFYNEYPGAPSILDFNNGYAAFCKGDLWGIIDKSGKVVIRPIYTNTLLFNEGIATFERDGIKRLTEAEGVEYYDYFGGKKGIVNTKGDEILTPQYDVVGEFSESYAWVSKKSKCGFIDKTGKEIIPLKYDDVGSFSEGLAIVKKMGKWGYVDKNGNEVVEIQYDDDGSIGGEEGSSNFLNHAKFKNGFALVFSKNKRYYIDKSGREYIEKISTSVQITSENKTFKGHEGNINSVCISPDGKTALSGGDDGFIKIWDVKIGECVKSLKVSNFRITVIAFSSDGKSFLFGSEDYEHGSAISHSVIKLLDSRTGNEIRNFPCDNGSEPMSVNFSSDAKYIVSGIGSIIKIWDVNTGIFLKNNMLHEGDYGVTSVSFSPDGKYLASSAGNTVKIWDVNSEVCINTFVGHQSNIMALEFSPDGKYIISGGNDNVIKLWDSSSGECIRTFIGHKERIWSLDFSPDGKYFVSGSSDYTVKIWDVNYEEYIRNFKGHHGSVASVCYSPNNNYVLSCSSDGTVKLWVI